MRKTKSFASLIALSLCLFHCSSQRKDQAPAQEDLSKERKLEISSMGTIFTFRWFEAENNSLPHEKLKIFVEKVLTKYDDTFSDWADHSELRRLEKEGLASPSPLRASPLFIEGLELANLAFRETQGLFDITLGAVVWKERSRPVGMTSLDLNLEEQKFRFGVDPIRLTFGGLVKGMALGELSQGLIANQMTSFHISAGGGNEVIAGRYLELVKLDEIKKSLKPGTLVFLSHSYPLQNEKQHIFDPRTPKKPLTKQTHVACLANTPETFKKQGALSDAFSTALVIESLPLNSLFSCTEIQAPRKNTP